MAAGVEIRLHARDLFPILVVRAALETRSQAHLHLGIDTARKGRVGMKIVHTAAHLEEIERVAGILFRGNARREWPVVNRMSLETAQAGGDRCPRILVFQM